MSDLAEFLLARITEDELAQRSSGHDTDWHEYGCDINSRDPGPFPCDCAVPVRVLAECAAKRAIIKRATAQRSVADMSPPMRYVGHVFTKATYVYGWDDVELLKLLAQPYASHADFDASWRVLPGSLVPPTEETP